MLTSLQVRNFAIIDELALDFEDGLTVMTGETGAGKSIMIDALGLVLGGRADKQAVTNKNERCEISASFDLSALPAAQSWLEAQALDDPSEPQACVIRRSISADGRSRAFINSQNVALQALRTLGGQLVEIHGQHAHQSLSDSATQRGLIDHFGKLQNQQAKVRQAFTNYDDVRQRYQSLKESATLKDDRLEFLRFQLRELQQVSDYAERHEQLVIERDKLAHSERLSSAAHGALNASYEADSNAQSLLAQALEHIDGVSEIAPELDNAAQLLREAEVNLAEAVEEIRRFQTDLVDDPERREQLEDILAGLKSASRKHHVEIRQLPDHLARIEAEIEQLAEADTQLAELAEKQSETLIQFKKLALSLHKARVKAARTFSDEVSQAMQLLGMEGGRFGVQVEHLPDRIAATGADQLSFQVSANKGMELQALSKVASGGELSRISLAIQVIAADLADVPCLVFDEIDSGVGGGVAEIVGKRLRELGNKRQVLCVTHLPQVASQGHQHFRVSKVADKKTTRTRMRELNPELRVEEIARMLGGVKITEKTLAHAREMLQHSAEQKRRA